MKKIFIFLITLIAAVSTSGQQNVRTPAEIYGQLFTDVQTQKVFPDSKTFPDCIPKRDPDEILKEYITAKKNNPSGINLDSFVKANFDLPKAPVLNYITKEKDVKMHIRNLWGVLRREKDEPVKGSSLLPLPYPYIVPGGRFREIYYWDSYFTMLGLKASGETEMIENMLNNFAYLINTYGHIPNGNRSYYISRSQPPFFSLMVDLLASIKGDEVYKTFLPALKKEYDFWMEGSEKLKPGQTHRRVVMLNDGTILNRDWDDAATPRPEGYREDVATAERSGRNKEEMYRNLRAGAESGIDFSSRWFADKKNITSIQVIDMIPADLNSLLLNLEYTLAKAEQLSGDARASEKYLQKATKRQSAIKKYCWNKNLNFYTDYNFKKQKQSEVVDPGGMYPFCIMKKTSVLEQQCRQAVNMLRKKLLKPGGIQTTENNTGQQWDAPNGWAPLEWMTIWGLDRC